MQRRQPHSSYVLQPERQGTRQKWCPSEDDAWGSDGRVRESRQEPSQQESQMLAAENGHFSRLDKNFIWV